jgi:Kef-type K+ transport system membrane component KefB
VTIAWVSFADIVTVLAVPFVLSTGGLVKTLGGALLVVAGSIAAGLVIHRLVRIGRVEALRDASHHLAWALDLRFSLLVLFALAWIAERFDTSALLAGFAAGVMVSLVGEPQRVADQLIGLGEGFFVPLFFVVLGARLDLRALVHSRDDLLLFALLAVGTTLVPVVTATVVRLPFSSGLLAAAEMGVPSAVASLGLSTGVLRPGQAAAIVAAAALSLGVASVGAIRLGASPSVSPREPDGAA